MPREWRSLTFPNGVFCSSSICEIPGGWGGGGEDRFREGEMEQENVRMLVRARYRKGIGTLREMKATARERQPTKDKETRRVREMERKKRGVLWNPPLLGSAVWERVPRRGKAR